MNNDNTTPIIIFDGVCNLCNGAVQFLLKRDKRDALRFTAMQSEAAKELLVTYQIPTNVDSFVFIDGNNFYVKSTAALQVSKYLPGLWKVFYLCRIIPVPIRDYVYDWVAKNRYKWFGRRTECMLPTPEIKKKFLN
ncbi:thiol-disulfide oxidoreductase DCC family protein [Cytobacillus sp. IB215316]|uniref:thiol-disulfide oxidoreductase DCC family protein n=1 Tax=Cytobacillus sp. IB215316 TaxID=3097354 RepID=UPI002A15B99A|nr:thiol-disulfide oxidoreductase DCC family protein [Cytobacillus sp. IB215316]MDX8360295.1 thiol-disulfide oxidoreductase DCC family protein [Cytobacillus sp. IB215316]